MTMPDLLQQAPENSQDQENNHSSSRNLPRATKQPFPKVREAQRTIPRCPQEETSKRKEKDRPSPPHPKYQKHPRIAGYTPGPPSKHVRTRQNTFTSPHHSYPSRTTPKVLRTTQQNTLRNRQQSLTSPRRLPINLPNRSPYRPYPCKTPLSSLLPSV